MKSHIKRILSGLLTIIFLFSQSIPALASSPSIKIDSNTSKNITVKYDGDSSILVESSGKTERIIITESENIRTVTIRDEQTEKENILKYNTDSGILYSSITNQSIQIDNIATRSESSYNTKYISYAQIRTVVGDIGTAGAIVGAIMTVIPGAQGAAKVVKIVAAIMKGAERWVIPNDSDHGIKLTVKTTKYYRTRLGHRQVYKIVNKITKAQKY